ncbi:MAG TPA: hypothetical protein VFY29_01775 [Terriglobia bacterium]|nr:hypothetical protein [Terriglobia bacterium]
MGVDQLERQIDKVTDAKPVFIASGIPGSVGSAAIALWRELAPLLLKNRTFRVWPFEGRLTDLRRTPVIVGEIYPGAAYTSALAEAIPAPRLRLAKTRAETRRSALSVLHSMRWALDLDVRFDGVQEAEESEDDFDACLTAAGLLRCVLQGLPLYAIFEDVAGVEGGILGAGTIDFSRPAQGFPADAAQETPQPPRSAAAPVTGQTFRCPISGCDKVFQKSRWGWDAHVGSLKKHPQWRPDLTSPPLRCEAFRREFPEFFDQASSAQLDPSERQRRQMLSLRQHPTAILPKRRRRALRPTYKRSGGAESGST